MRKKACGLTDGHRTLVLLLTCFVLVLISCPYRLGIVLGDSMSPDLNNGQLFISTRVSRNTTLHQGDVVLFTVNNQMFIKRIYALGGETVWGLQTSGSSASDRIIPATEAVYVRQLIGRYRGLGRLVEFIVPEDHIYVLGDDESNSYDSRRFGAVPRESVRSRVVIIRLCRLWGPVEPGPGLVRASEKQS